MITDDVFKLIAKHRITFVAGYCDASIVPSESYLPGTERATVYQMGRAIGLVVTAHQAVS